MSRPVTPNFFRQSAKLAKSLLLEYRQKRSDALKAIQAGCHPWHREDFLWGAILARRFYFTQLRRHSALGPVVKYSNLSPNAAERMSSRGYHREAQGGAA